MIIDPECYENMLDELDRNNEWISDLEEEIGDLREELSAYKSFARWVAWWFCVNHKEHGNMFLFSETACKKLYELGEIEPVNDFEDWKFEWDDKEDWYKEMVDMLE